MPPKASNRGNRRRMETAPEEEDSRFDVKVPA